MSIIVALIGYAMLAVTNWLDKYVVSGERLAPTVIAVYATIFVLPIFALVPFEASYLSSGFDYGMAALSGTAFTLALVLMFAGFKRTELSHAAPLTGAMTTISVAIIGAFILGESLSVRQWFGVVILVGAAIAFAFQRTRERFAWSSAMLYLALAGLAFGISHTSAKYLYTEYGFYAGLVWSRGMMAVAGALLLLVPGVWRGFVNGFTKKVPAAAASTLIIVINRVLGALGVLVVQWAISLGSVVIVNALQGFQYAALIVGIVIAGQRAPQSTREFFTVGEYVQEGLALVAMMAGLLLVLG